ncbi:TrmB family transcriptional regulator [Photobacterium marinum]|uniref:TrmB family transcriptional regulator n=1 Tax=Photobacterium marinum TaxID=1056511 RepID=UPI00055B6A2C|nr:helix-turn-helix domain-containing protein [Photobacterium marinum]
MTQLVDKLMAFGFSKTDALVYLCLLQNGRSSGYKIAKEISLSRSTVYSSIDNLYNNGYIFLCDGQTKEYEAKSPDLIFEQIEKKCIDNIHYLKTELKNLMSEDEKEFIFNVAGFENLKQKVREVLNHAEKEIYINTDFSLHDFKDELVQAIERGVRVIVFSFKQLDKPHPDIEMYSRSPDEESLYPSRRLIVVADMHRSLIFSNFNEAVGVYTNNPLINKLVAEHIHSDIYLSEYEKGLDQNQHVFRVNSLHENTNEMYVIEHQND